MAVTIDRDKSGADDSALDPADRKLVDRYRQASAELDERPAASARASILAAAAREVGARPVDAAALPRARQRWPLAAAATVMLSTLAVMLAIRTNEEMPQFSPPAEPARGVANSVTPPAAKTTEAPMVEQSTQLSRKREMRDQQAPESRPAQTQERSAARANNESDSSSQAPREANRPSRAEAPATSPPSPARQLEKASKDEPAASPAPPPVPEPAVRAKLRAEQGAAGAVAPTSPTDQASSDARWDMARAAGPAPSSAAQSEGKQADESAAAWLERIIKLRREGRQDEADAELKRFRERYPQVQPPAEALGPAQPPAGTR